MRTVPEFELEQKTSEFIQFVRDYSANRKKDFTIKSERDGAVLSCIDGDVSLYFTV